MKRFFTVLVDKIIPLHDARRRLKIEYRCTICNQRTSEVMRQIEFCDFDPETKKSCESESCRTNNLGAKR